MVPGLMEREAVSIVISMSGLGGRSSSKTAELTPLTFVSIKYVRGHAFPSASGQLRTEQYGAAARSAHVEEQPRQFFRGLSHRAGHSPRPPADDHVRRCRALHGAVRGPFCRPIL